MSDNSQIPSYPKNLAYNVKRLNGSYIRSKVRVNGDKSSYNANERATFNLPLRMIDLRTVVAYAKVTTTAPNYLPRGGLNSLIDNLSISVNSRTLNNIPNYGYIWNALADHENYYAAEQLSKRIYENADPSFSYNYPQGEGGATAPTLAIKPAQATATDSMYLCINNWLGLFGSSSSPVVNLNDWGQMVVTLTFAPNSACWMGHAANGTETFSTTSYSVTELFLSFDCITFTDSLYQTLVGDALQGEGLNVAYSDYLVYQGNLTAKSTAGITANCQFSTNSLDYILATFRHASYDTGTYLLLGAAVTSGGAGTQKSFAEVVANPVSNGGLNGGFNQSRFFQRCGGGIDSSSFYVNNSPYTIASSPIEIFNNTQQTLGNQLIDLNGSSLHQGCFNTSYWCSHYFLDALSLENISGDPSQNFVSGLSANSSVISVQYQAKFKSLTDNVIPIIIGKCTKWLNIRMGRALDLME